MLGERDPESFQAISIQLLQSAARSAPLATSALYMLTLHPPLLEHREAITAIQRSTMEMGYGCEAVAAAAVRGEPVDEAVDRLAAMVDHHAKLASEFLAHVDDSRPPTVR